MTCRTIMTAHPHTLKADDPVGKAIGELLGHRHIILPVVGDNDRYLGVFGVFDLVGLLLPRVATLDSLLPDLGFLKDATPKAMRDRLAEIALQPISQHLRTDLPTLQPETSVVEALLLFYRGRLTLPVVDEKTGRLLGVVSQWDALAHLTGHRQ